MKKTVTLAALLALTAMPAFANMHDDGKVKMMVDDKMSMMDANSDGKVSMREHQDAMNRMFDEADLNGDDMLTREEMMEHKKKEMYRHKDNSAPVSNNTKTNKTPK